MNDRKPQTSIFGDAEWWAEHWRGMPEFIQHDLSPVHSIQVDFKTRKDLENFSRLVGQKVLDGETLRTRSIWFPEAEYGSISNKRWISDAPLNPQYPVYIISKGRWDSRLTAKSLEKIGVPFYIVVEPQERDRYAAFINSSKILVTPFSNLGQGSIPVRNFVWEHSVGLGAKRHWVLDDNIRWFYRLHRNMKLPVADGTIFRCAEDFTDRYENVAIAGFQYFMFASRKTVIPPIYLNTRIYSMILIRNDLKLGVDGIGQWRGRYNEDTDLSLRALKDGHCTVLFNSFLGDKVTTMKMSGGNTAELYKDDGRLKMAQSLVDQHPDVTKISWKWNRWQHSVDYSRFKTNALKLKQNVSLGDVNEYGMNLELDGKLVERHMIPEVIASVKRSS